MILIYPTSSNPPTYGHADLINRLSPKVDKIYWLSAQNREKQDYFSADLKLSMMQDYLDYYNWKNVIIDHTDNSVARYALNKNCNLILRGIRNHGDFTSEFELAEGNRSINEELETLCILARPEFCSISSSIARELLRLGENTTKYLLPSVAEKAKNIIQASY